MRKYIEIDVLDSGGMFARFVDTPPCAECERMQRMLDQAADEATHAENESDAAILEFQRERDEALARAERLESDLELSRDETFIMEYAWNEAEKRAERAEAELARLRAVEEVGRGD